MKEVLTPTGIGLIVGCSPQEVRHRMRNGTMPFGTVIRPGAGGKQCKYSATISETAQYAGITREEAIRRLGHEKES